MISRYKSDARVVWFALAELRPQASKFCHFLNFIIFRTPEIWFRNYSRKHYNHIEMELQSDTNPKIAALQHTLLREATPARKLAILGQMNETIKILALSGLQSRFPNASPEILRRRLADLILGPKVANLVYGPPLDQG